MPSDVNSPDNHSPIAVVSMSGWDVALGRYRRQLFLVWPCAYGFFDQRILICLNTPDWSASPEHARSHLWYNPCINYDPVHGFLQLAPDVVRRSGRTRPATSCCRSHNSRLSAPSQASDQEKESMSREIEIQVLIPEHELLRQCCYCYQYEESRGEYPERFRLSKGSSLFWCGEDIFWCNTVCC